MKRDPQTIHKTMAAIKGKNTGLELSLRKELTRRGIHYQINSKRAFGHPDILFQKEKVAVFCDSEFWHGYNFDEASAIFHSNRPFWVEKIKRNIARDKLVNQTLAEEGYKVLRFWGKELEGDILSCADKVEEALNYRRQVLEKCQAITVKTTLAYIEKDGCYLMIFRNKKKNDENKGKWIGVGGHLEGKESYIHAFKREIKEETGLDVKEYSYFGKVDFINQDHPGERMFLFKVTSFSGELIPCNEGELAWIEKEKLNELPMWEGDKRFLPLLDQERKKPFHMAVKYDKEGNLEDFIPYF